MAGIKPTNARTDDAVGKGYTSPLSAWTTVVLLTAIMGAALALHLWGIRRDLPFDNDLDEANFVLPAVRIAATGNFNPGWFGHPGSTLIYPLAAVYRAWDIIDRPAFVQGTSEFYLLGRLVSVTYAVLSIPLVFLVGRRAFGTEGALAALLGAWLTVLLPTTVDMAQTTRTDSACIFFTLLALWLCLLVHARPTIRRALLAGTASGLAVSTKFSLIALVPCFVAVLMTALWRDRYHTLGPMSPRRAHTAALSPNMWACLIIGLLIVPVAFAASSPYLFLDPTALAKVDTHTTHPGADGFSPPQNFYWYVGSILPATLGSARLLLALTAAALAVWRRETPPFILLGFMLVYLIEISLHPLHWIHWVGPLLPVCMLFAAAGLVGAVTLLADRLQAPSLVRTAAVLLAAAFLSYAPLCSIIGSDRLQANPSTQVVARLWIIEHLPPGSRIAEEWYTAPLKQTSFDVSLQFSLATHSVADYARSGFRYLLVSSSVYDRYFNEPTRYPAEVAFYRSLPSTSRLLEEFEPSATRGGPTVQIYELPIAPRPPSPPP